MTNTTIVVASDHRGVILRNSILEYLKTLNIQTINLGPQSAEEKTDYPLIAEKTCQLILQNNATYGILICNTGIGMSITANRFKGIRAALCYNHEHAELAKKHNNANILIFGSNYIKTEEAISAIKKFLESIFEKGRHAKRVKMIDSIR
ncbi:MAG: ribose 5-phosphate isomerase B [Rickettsiales bacterium]|nr:ribose 5-phosphate isomerase B [Rickettsiales bacterium]